MNHSSPPQNLSNILNGAVEGQDRPRIEVREILDSFGNRAHGPALFFFASLELLPFVSAIPGMYIVTAVVVILLAGQLLMGRSQPWLPKRVLDVAFSREKLQTMIEKTSGCIKWLERLVKPRFTVVVDPPFLQIIAAICICLAVLFFPLAPIPGSEKILAIPVWLFGLAITARDGLMAILGLAVIGVSAGGLIYFWPSIARAGMETLQWFGF